ncbi:MAG: SPOR domain-containing protein [Myxococcota bacterium]
MAKQTEERRDPRAPRGASFLRVVYGAGLVALGACLGIVIGSLSETPRLVLERLRGPVETVDVAVPEQEKAKAAPLERFGDLQEGRAPKSARAKPKEAKPAVEAEPPPPLVPPAELEPAPPVAAAPPATAVARPDAAPAPTPVEKPAAAQPHGAVVQVASYVERKPADDLVRKLGESGFDAYVSQPAAANGRFRVRIRPAGSETAAELATRLRGFGFDTWATSE